MDIPGFPVEVFNSLELRLSDFSTNTFVRPGMEASYPPSLTELLTFFHGVFKSLLERIRIMEKVNVVLFDNGW